MQQFERKPVFSKLHLNVALLNMDGLTEVTLADVKDTLDIKKPDLLFGLETKRREEEYGSDISIEDYEVHEVRRSDVAGDKDGGGLVVWRRVRDGLLLRHYAPKIVNAALAYVNKEMVWYTIESGGMKTAICGMYLGCQHSNDGVHGEWNNGFYQVVQEELVDLRSKGYRVLLLGDLNGHIGNVPGVGIPGNHGEVNQNGRRILSFLEATAMVHINGASRMDGQVESRLAQGLWTRQRAGVSTILDYAIITKEHLESVVSMEIDDRGVYGGDSDHNWIFVRLRDQFKTKQRLFSADRTKETWDIKDDQAWSAFQASCLDFLASSDVDRCSSVNSLASLVSQTLLHGLHKGVGLVTPCRKVKSTSLPPHLVVVVSGLGGAQGGQALGGE